MVKAEWGTKRACPKCNTRFYDLTHDDPVTCIACGQSWMPEPFLKSKQTQLFEPAKPAAKVAGDGDEAATDEDLDIAEAEDTDAPDLDIADDEDELGTVVAADEEEER